MVVTYAGSVDNCSGGSVSLFNVAQQTAEAVNVNFNTSSNTISTNISVVTDGAWVIDVVGCGNSGSFTATSSGMSERFDVSPGSSTAAGSTLPVATAGTVAMSWQHSGANRLAHSVAAFAPASSSGTNPPGASSNPSPADSATGVGLSSDFSWTAGANAASTIYILVSIMTQFLMQTIRHRNTRETRH